MRALLGGLDNAVTRLQDTYGPSICWIFLARTGLAKAVSPVFRNADVLPYVFETPSLRKNRCVPFRREGCMGIVRHKREKAHSIVILVGYPRFWRCFALENDVNANGTKNVGICCQCINFATLVSL